MSRSDRVLASTMSVDDYFDELISQVRQDHTNLLRSPDMTTTNNNLDSESLAQP